MELILWAAGAWELHDHALPDMHGLRFDGRLDLGETVQAALDEFTPATGTTPAVETENQQ